MRDRLLLDLDVFPAAYLELADHAAVDEDHVAVGIVAADLALGFVQEAVVADPVGDVVGQPRVALGAVIVGTGRADFERELFVPVDPLGAIGHVEAVLDAQARMRLLHLPRHLVGAAAGHLPAEVGRFFARIVDNCFAETARQIARMT